jgi:alpha-galactosidase
MKSSPRPPARLSAFFLSFPVVLALCAAPAPAETFWLDTFDLTTMRQSYGVAHTNIAVRGGPLKIAGQQYERGVGTHATSRLWISLAGTAARFTAEVGVDDAAGGGSICFRVLGDGSTLFDSGIMKTNQKAKPVEVDLKGIKNLLLLVTDAGDGIAFDHANWAQAKIEMISGAPKAISPPDDEKVILTPRPGPEPRINGPKVYGCRPGNPFFYRVPTQGQRPIRFTAKHLPKTLSLNPATGLIDGVAPEAGEYLVTIRARNNHGTVERELRIVSGDKLALTPPMGWNHWYAHYDRITDPMMREAADIMVSSGMADVGYQYVNIDDCWMNSPSHKDPMRVGPARTSTGELLSNKYFPDMKALADYIHSKGLKAGLYTSLGPTTCAGFHASYQHEAQDARTFAEWGYDFVKYDWCSYGRIAEGREPAATNIPAFGKGTRSLDVYQYPYQLMGGLLKRQQRDIVYNLCQYGMGNVWEWGEKVDGHCWRTAGDLGFELDRVVEVALKNSTHRAWSRPGAWNDPDYIQIGWIGSAHTGGTPEPCKMNGNEQYAYMSLWVLMAAPLFYSGDMTKLDAFTLNVLCNPEVLDVNQDPLGQCAEAVPVGENGFLMIKDLEDGSKAVGLFNRGEFPLELSAGWPTIGIKGPHMARDLWRQRDIGLVDRAVTIKVPRHGVMLLKLTATKPS